MRVLLLSQYFGRRGPTCRRERSGRAATIRSSALRGGRHGPLAVALAALATGVVPAGASDARGPCAPVPLALAHAGHALAPIVVPAGAIPAERTAATELAAYLRHVTGARFVVREERAVEDRPAIHVGPTAAARAAGGDPALLGPEEWLVATDGDGRLILSGGRPRGALYAVYRFLEDDLGVRWWTPFEERVPRAAELEIGPLRRQGAPVFAYRDVHGVPGPRAFCARNRLNGHATRLGWAWGGAEAYGPPSQVHNFFDYVPPDEWWASHPEYYSEIGGLRVAERAQLCLTNPELPALVAARLRARIAETRARAAERHEPAPRLFAFSQNDWGRPCACPRCAEVERREGSPAGSLVEFVNGLADAVREQYPDVLLDTLAYGYSFPPPRAATLRDNATVRVSALYQRDFSRALGDPANAEVRGALAGWAARTAHLRVWDYAVTFGPAGDLPRPNLAFLAADLRLYRAHGVEGLFVQHDPAVGPHLQDLVLWVLAKLLEDPARDEERLVREFTDGYYGAAGPHVRSYLAALEAAARRKPAPIRFDAAPAAYAYLDLGFVRAAQAAFDAAERAVTGDRVARRRVRQARLALDRATLQRWAELEAEGHGAGPLGLDRAAVERRLRDAWYDRVRRRLPRDERREARRELDDELHGLAARGG